MVAARRGISHGNPHHWHRLCLAGSGVPAHLFLANILVLSWADYSFVQPASSIAYGISALLGYFMLGEPVSPLRWTGIAIICLGVFVVGQSSPQSRPSSQSPLHSLERGSQSLERT